MPLSKKRDRERKERVRLEKLLIQPKRRIDPILEHPHSNWEIDADGNPMPEY